ncbi:hypothetical protein ACLB2K_008272 [Fragaria x ananassa]
MAYDMRHRARDMHVLDDVDPLAGLALSKDKLTRGDAEAKCQQVREAEENNRTLSQRLEQVQDAAVFRDQADAAGKEVAELKEAMRGKDEQVEARELAVAKVASLET